MKSEERLELTKAAPTLPDRGRQTLRNTREYLWPGRTDF